MNGHALDTCRRCGLAFVNPRPSRAEILEMYRTLGGHGQGAITAEEVLESERVAPNSTVDAQRIARRLVGLTGNGRLLDVGCGYGFFSAAAREAGFDVDALEVAPLEREIARRIAGVEAVATEFEEFDAPASTYDAIIMSQVLEHAVDPHQWCAKAKRLLRPGGVLCVAVPNFGGLLRKLLQERDPYITPPVHLNYFTSESLRMLLGANRLDVVGMETTSRVRADAVARRLRPVTGRFARFSTPLVRVGQRPLLWPLDRFGLGMFLNVYARRIPHGSDSSHRASE